MDPKKNLQTLKSDIFDYLEFLKTLPEKTQTLLQKFEKGDIGVKIDTRELLGIKTEFDRQNDSRILGLITMVLFLVSSVFAFSEGIRSIWGVRLSSMGFMFSTVLLFWLAVRLIKKPTE